MEGGRTQLIRANIEPDTVYEVHMIVEEQRNGKTYYMLVDQHRHLVYATKLLRYYISSYGYEEDVTTLEEISCIDAECSCITDDTLSAFPSTPDTAF